MALLLSRSRQRVMQMTPQRDVVAATTNEPVEASTSVTAITFKRRIEMGNQACKAQRIKPSRSKLPPITTIFQQRIYAS